MKFLGVSLDENLTWKKYVKYLKDNITKNIVYLLKLHHS